MQKKLEEIVVLYDKANQGKTSTLRALIKELVGSLPNLKGDIRVVIPNYHAKNQRKKVCIFIATCGDIPDVIEDNVRFFQGKMPDAKNVPTFIYDNGGWMPLVSETQLAEYAANICFSACRTDGIGPDCMQYFMHAHLAYTFVSMWIRLSQLRQKLNIHITKTKQPNWSILAKELKEIIDNKFAKRIIL